jgi:aminotransferase
MVFPGSMFGDDSPNYIRVGYLQPLPLIREAMARIGGFVARRRAAA